MNRNKIKLRWITLHLQSYPQLLWKKCPRLEQNPSAALVFTARKKMQQFFKKTWKCTSKCKLFGESHFTFC